MKSRPKSQLPSAEGMTSAYAIEWVAIDQIKLSESNARQHPEPQMKHLMAAITAFRVLQPLLVNTDLKLIAGHGRCEAARRLGITRVPVIRLPHLNEVECRALALADNRIAELAEWDKEALKVELNDIVALDLDFSVADVTGFAAPEIDALVHSGDFAAADPADEVLPIISNTAPITQLGDLWRVGDHAVYCGDARMPESYQALLGALRARVLICDGPFNLRVDRISGKGRVRHREFPMASGEMSIEEFAQFNCDWLSAALAASADGALAYAFIHGLGLAELIQGGRKAGLTPITVAVWDKGCGGMGSLYRSQIEHVVVFKAGRGAHTNNVQLGKYGRNRTNLWTYPGMNRFGRDREAALKTHPTIKPVSLLADIVLDASHRGDILLDPFLGAGSSIIAAHRTGRRGFGIELDRLYVDAALERLFAVLGIDPVRTSDGAAWSELKRLRDQGAQP